MAKLTITKLFINTTNQDGTPITNPFTHQPETRITLYTQEFAGRAIYGVQNADNASWRVGSVVEANVVEKTSKQGKQYLIIKELSKTEKDLESVKLRLSALEKIVNDMVSPHKVPAQQTQTFLTPSSGLIETQDEMPPMPTEELPF